MDLKALQDEVSIWAGFNFGESPWQMPFMGLVEELGELSHSLLKQWQGIRGSSQEHEDKAKDAVGDIVIYLADLCRTRGWDFNEIVEETWDRVSRRNWKKNSQDGV